MYLFIYLSKILCLYQTRVTIMIIYLSGYFSIYLSICICDKKVATQSLMKNRKSKNHMRVKNELPVGEYHGNGLELTKVTFHLARNSKQLLGRRYVVYLSFYVYTSIYLPISLSIHPSIYLSFHLWVCTCLRVYGYVLVCEFQAVLDNHLQITC